MKKEPQRDYEYWIRDAMKKSEAAAWSALARYKFERFGYHAWTWVNLNRLLAKRRPSPFHDLVRWTRGRTGILPGKEAS